MANIIDGTITRGKLENSTLRITKSEGREVEETDLCAGEPVIIQYTTGGVTKKAAIITCDTMMFTDQC